MSDFTGKKLPNLTSSNQTLLLVEDFPFFVRFSSEQTPEGTKPSAMETVDGGVTQRE